MQLSREQMLAATHQNGPCLVLAGPGSGKTSTLISRIEYLISECHVRPEEILMLTFSKASASEMRNRCATQIKEDASLIFFGTFHSFFFHVLQWFCGYHASDVVKEADWKQFHPEESQDKFYQTETYREEAYREWKESAHKLDYQDMEQKCLKMLFEQPESAEQLRRRFRYIMVDEFQDISEIQYQILKLLVGKEKNLFVVGDDDQAIYGFRGASPGIMLRLKEEYPEIRICRLELNYRCPAEITQRAGKLICHNEHRYQKCIRSSLENDIGHMEVIEAENSIQECKVVMESIRVLMSRGVEDHEIAVIGRVREDLRRMYDTCMEYQVPVCWKEKRHSIYEHFLFQDIWAYLMLASGSRERRYLMRVLNRPQRYLSAACAEKEIFSFGEMLSWYGLQGESRQRILELQEELYTIARMTPYAALHYICRKIGYLSYIKEYAKERGLDSEKLLVILEEIIERSKKYSEISEWEKVIHGSDQKEKKSGKDSLSREAGVRLLTMHGAKGLEFSYVFVLSVNEGNIPSKKAVFSEEIEEERRLFYVALTRAKKQAVLTVTKEKNGKPVKPSRFLKEMDF